MHFKLRKSRNGQFYFTLNGKNGQVIMTSETYTRKASCKKMCEKIRAFMKLDGFAPIDDLTKPKQ